MSVNQEIAADLVVNDKAGAVIERIKGSFSALDHKVNHVGGELRSFAKNTMSTALGVSIAGFGGTLENVFHHALEAGEDLNKQQKSVASALMMTERSGRGYKEVREQANGVQEELKDLAIAAGVSSDSIVESFNDIASRTNKNTQEVQEFMGTMVQAGRIAPGGLASITQGFEQIEMGVARARNPIVQMISSTGLLEGNARQVAKEMQKMAPDKMMALAEKAITQMAKKMEKVPLSFGESVTSLKEMQGQIFEIVGAPIFKGLTPMVSDLQKQIHDHKRELVDFAEKVGEKATKAFAFAGDKLKEAFAYVNANWESIARSMGNVADSFMSAGKFLAENKELFSHMAMLGTGGFVGGMSGNPGARSAADLLKGGGGNVVGGALAGGKMGGVTGAALGAAIGGLGTLFEESVALGDELAALHDPLGRTTKYYEAEIASLEKLQKARGNEINQLNADIKGNDQFIKASESLIGAYGAQPQGGAANAFDLKDVGFANMSQNMVDRAAVELDAGTQNLAIQMASDFKTMMDYAQQSHNASAMEAVQNTLANSQRLQYALAASGVDVGKGFDDLIDAMVEGGKMTAAAGKQAKELVKGGKDLSKLGKPTVNIGGGNTINVKQEFREGDPDRIMMAFKAGVTKAAVARTNARISGPFGGF